MASNPRGTTMLIEKLLATCGVTASTLSKTAPEALDQDGYVVLPDVAEAAWLAKLQDSFEQVAQMTPAAAHGTRHIEHLAWADPAFDAVYVHPVILAAVHHILGRAFRLLLFNGRDPQPGFGQQGLHKDWLPRAPGDVFSVVTAIWMLDAFTFQNGATRVVPGSHQDPRLLPKAMQQPTSWHPAERLMTGQAGSVLVFNGHLWHSGTRNRSSASRRALQVQYVALDVAPPAVLPQPIPARLGAAARALLGG